MFAVNSMGRLARCRKHASLSMQGSLISNGRSAVSHLSGYPAAVGVGPFAVQLRVVWSYINMGLPYVLTGPSDWNSRLVVACEGDSMPGKLS